MPTVKQLILEAETAKSDTSKLVAHISLVNHYLDLDRDSAYIFLKNGLRLADSIVIQLENSTEGSKNSILNLVGKMHQIGGYYYYKKSDLTNSLIEFELAARFFKLCGNKSDHAETLNNLAVQFKSMGDHTKSIEYNYEALDLFLVLGDSIGIASVLNSLSLIHRDQDDISRALEYANEALAINRLIKNKVGESLCLNTLAGLNKVTGDTTQALVYYEKSLSIRKELNDRAGQAAILNNIGVIYKNWKVYDVAINHFNQSLIISSENGHLMGQAYAKSNLGEVYYEQGNYHQALKYGKEALAISQQVNSGEIIKRSTGLLTKVYKKLEQWEKAFEMQELYMLTQESILNEESIRIAQQTAVRYNYEKETALKKKEEEQSNAVKKERDLLTTVLYYSLAGFIFLLLVIIFIITLRLKTVRLKNIIIEKQNDERKLLLQEVHHRVKNNFQIVSSLLRLQSYTVNDDSVSKTFNEAITRINAMAIVHDIIYRQEEFSNISTELYLNKLVEGLERTVIDRNIHFHVVADETPLKIETLIHIGIIINELVINTIKYAFPKNFDKSAISIDLSGDEERYCLIYKDNGVGMNPELKKDSFGMELIETIIEQLDGAIEITNETNWNTVIRIMFKEN